MGDLDCTQHSYHARLENNESNNFDGSQKMVGHGATYMQKLILVDHHQLFLQFDVVCRNIITVAVRLFTHSDNVHQT